ncbi:MAG: hypothetical protein NC417_11985 [Candidatus Gastranaerophilales bacterium]|nr:hypothetical protein [Candidatus Gastranaerophilales bacterium]
MERNYITEFIWIWVKAVIVFLIVGFIFGSFSKMGAADPDVVNGLDTMAGIAGALVVFGFSFFNKVVPFNLFGNHDAVFWFWAIKLIASLVIGMIAFPIVNIYYIIRILIMIFRRR